MMHVALLEGQALILQIVLLLKIEHGSYVNKMLKKDFRGTSRATIYRAIAKLEGSGLITSELKDVGGTGGIRREYRLTDSGDAVATHLLEVENTLKTSSGASRGRRRAEIS